MTFKALEARMSVTARYGKPGNKETPIFTAPFMGGHLSSFYANHGVKLKDMRSALRASRVGSVYELSKGQGLIVPQNNS